MPSVKIALACQAKCINLYKNFKIQLYVVPDGVKYIYLTVNISTTGCLL